MESSKQSPRKLMIAGVATAVVALGLTGYLLSSRPAESQVVPKMPSAPASASVPAAAAKPAAPVAAPARHAVEHAEAIAKPSAEPAATRSREQAVAALMALPELQAWSALIEKNSNGKTHGAVIEYDPAPRKLNGKNYYQFSYVENTPESALRWESFLVSSSDDEILVEDGTSDEVISLARWRREKHPMKRTSIDG